jgi:hypothetical protein
MIRLTHSCPAFALAFLLFASPAFAAPFTDNLDGTVTDDATGLIWDKCSWGQTWDSGGNTCSASGDATTHNWADALALAITANAASHRGVDDWRLPNRTELESLVDIDASTGPTIDITAFPNTPSNWYWTSTTYAPAPADAWHVYFNDGYSDAYNKTLTFRVRLVRSGQSFGAFDDQAQAQDDPAAIPTLAEWTLLMLAGLLVLIGFGWLRRPFPHRDA